MSTLEHRDAPQQRRTRRQWLWATGPSTLVAAAVVFNLILLRSEASYVPLLNDGSVHAQMVRYASAQFGTGSLPLRGWYPYLGLGSPQFLHYQSLGAMLTGAVGQVVGPDRAFSWSLYLLWSTWPVGVYVGARLFELDRWASAVAGACATLLVSVPGVGFEPEAYLWIGFGVWSQLFAMWTLPLAWGFSWRAIARGARIWPAALFIAATIGFHYMTGYLAILATPLWVLLRPSRYRERLGRLVLVGLGTVALSAWALVPLELFGRWAAINEFLQHTPSADSYGARQVLGWLFTGRIFDTGRFPVVSVLVGIGVVDTVRRVREDERARAVLAVFVLCLLLFFGRPTLGPLLDLLPRSGDLFLRRFMSGVQLAGLFLAGLGAMAAWRLLGLAGRRVLERGRPQVGALLDGAAALVMAIAILAPAWTATASYAATDSRDRSFQRAADAGRGAVLARLAAAMSSLGPGRVYAGMPTNWGANFLVGDIPVFKYLSNLDYDVVGYTLRTASLMSNPEADFNEANPADYQIFGIRYLILPVTKRPAVVARFVRSQGPFALWEIPDVTGYVQLADTTVPLIENRRDVGVRSDSFLNSPLAAEHLYPTVSYAGAPPAAPTDPTGIVLPDPPGQVLSQDVRLGRGRVSAVITAARTCVVVLKASYDPGWQATVDGYPVTTEMVAPALVGVLVPAGPHVVSYTYVGYSHYPELFEIAGAGMLAMLLLPHRRRITALARRTRSAWR